MSFLTEDHDPQEEEVDMSDQGFRAVGRASATADERWGDRPSRVVPKAEDIYDSQLQPLSPAELQAPSLVAKEREEAAYYRQAATQVYGTQLAKDGGALLYNYECFIQRVAAGGASAEVIEALRLNFKQLQRRLSRGLDNYFDQQEQKTVRTHSVYVQEEWR